MDKQPKSQTKNSESTFSMKQIRKCNSVQSEPSMNSINNTLAAEANEVSLSHILRNSSSSQKASESVMMFKCVKPVVKEQIVYSDRTKMQAKVIKRLVEEQERETAKRKEVTTQEPSIQASETFGRAMDYIDEQVRKERKHTIKR